jgi:hypothetical protein
VVAGGVVIVKGRLASMLIFARYVSIKGYIYPGHLAVTCRFLACVEEPHEGLSNF